MRIILFVTFFFIVVAMQAQKNYPAAQPKKVKLPNGWSLSPAGRSLPLGDLPLNMAVSSSKKYMAITNNGQSDQAIQLINPATEKIWDDIAVAKAWYGLKFSADEKYLYASGGNDNRILKYEIVNNKLRLIDSIQLGKKWPVKICPAGIEIDDAAQIMYVVTIENNSFYTVDLRTKKVIEKYDLDGEGYTCLLSPNKKELYISCWGCDKILIFNTLTKKFETSITVGDNPNEICMTKNGKWLFVANANDNSVSVINIQQHKVVETLNAALYPQSPTGSTTNGLALSANEQTLYIANADNNCLAVFDVHNPGNSISKGFIPTGWYPTNVKVIGKKIFVTNGKGFTSMANPNGPNPVAKTEDVAYQGGDTGHVKPVQYIGGLFKGTLSIMDMPSAQQMSRYSKMVYQNTPYSKQKELITGSKKESPIPLKVGGKSPIQYVFYIVKENRTYDQVLGDMKEGNGDSSLVLFGENITPNQHALAKQFVLLDNFYADGEVSADGHNWSLGGYADDYLEKTWPTAYGGRGGTYSAEGSKTIANNKNGFIWDYCKRAGVSYRTYGEFADDYKPNLPVLKDHYCTYFTSWDQKVRDTTRFRQWKRDFDSMLAINQVPRFNSLRFINDHTEGLRLGRPTPFAHVADNDLAVGLFVEYLSHTSIWKESVVFIVEDDAQNGPDHVDAHRTTAYAAGGFVKRNFADHTMYSTTSILRTIELILGLPPMTQYDAAATPMYNSFSTKPDSTPFISKKINVALGQKNIVRNEWQKRSELFNFTKEDAVPDMEFNIVLWHGIKGDAIPFPGPKRAAFVHAKADD